MSGRPGAGRATPAGAYVHFTRSGRAAIMKQRGEVVA